MTTSQLPGALPPRVAPANTLWKPGLGLREWPCSFADPWMQMLAKGCGACSERWSEGPTGAVARVRGQDSGDVPTGPLGSHCSPSPCQCRPLGTQVEPELERGRRAPRGSRIEVLSYKEPESLRICPVVEGQGSTHCAPTWLRRSNASIGTSC